MRRELESAVGFRQPRIFTSLIFSDLSVTGELPSITDHMIKAEDFSRKLTEVHDRFRDLVVIQSLWNIVRFHKSIEFVFVILLKDCVKIGKEGACM